MPPRKRKPKKAPLSAWHVLLVLLCAERHAKSFRVDSEVELLRRLARIDLVFERKKGRQWDQSARVLRRLWSWIAHVAVVEFKSAAEPLRRGDLVWWLALAQAYWSVRLRKRRRGRVQAVLLVARRTPTLIAEVERAGLTLRDEGGGYLALEGALLEAKVIVLAEVAEAEKDPLLRIFSGGTVHDKRARKWLTRHFREVLDKMGSRIDQMPPELVEVFLASLPANKRLAGLAPDKVLRNYAPEQRLKGLAPEQRLKGLAPEQRLKGLAPEQRLKGLAPEQRLKGLAPEQIARALSSLPAETRRRIASRLQNGATARRKAKSKTTGRRRKGPGKK